MMFVTDLELKATAEPDYWVVTAPLQWDEPDGQKIIVPEGFRTDLASIPRLFRNLPFLDPDGVSRRPAVLHDYLYSQQVARASADYKLFKALREEGASYATAWTFWAAVRCFGWHPYREDAAPR